MKTISKLSLALLAAVGLSVAASAGTVTTTYSDLILGFRDTTTTSVNLEVNLGNVSQFTDAAAGSTFTVSNLNAADLTTVFGSGWNSSTLQFGIAGSTGKIGNGAVGPNGQALSTLWVSYDTNLSAPTRKIASQQNIAVTQYLNLLTSANQGLNSSNVTVLSNAFSAQTDATTTGSWTQSLGTNGSAFGYFNPIGNIESTGGFTGSVTMDLYELTPGSGNGGLVGTFSLTDTGVLSFTSSGLYASAIPEPSTYGILAGSMMLGFVVLRRRLRNKA